MCKTGLAFSTHIYTHTPKTQPPINTSSWWGHTETTAPFWSGSVVQTSNPTVRQSLQLVVDLKNYFKWFLNQNSSCTPRFSQTAKLFTPSQGTFPPLVFVNSIFQLLLKAQIFGENQGILWTDCVTESFICRLSSCFTSTDGYSDCNTTAASIHLTLSDSVTCKYDPKILILLCQGHGLVPHLQEVNDSFMREKHQDHLSKGGADFHHHHSSQFMMKLLKQCSVMRTTRCHFYTHSDVTQVTQSTTQMC